MADGERRLTNSPVVNAYLERTPASAALFERARQVLPSGITHDSRYIRPYGIAVERADGARKWDADGNDYVDYFGGHGALLLGHRNPEVERAVEAALHRGTHFGSSHRFELEWAEAVQRLMPAAERIRFTSSGTEATHMALRLSRAFTGRQKLLRFRSHFHGWHDHMAFGVSSHMDGSPTPGVLQEVAEQVVLVDPGDIAAVAAAFAADDDIAAVILEPTGASWGAAPITPAFLADLRELTEKHGVVLIFDEVVTGFRVSPGGAQEAFGIRPDLSTLAKILAGGLPGGAVVGRADIMQHLDFQAAAERGFEKIQHPGTYNANPLSAAAGACALGIIADGDACERANAFGARLRTRLNEVFRAAGVAWAAYGSYSTFHIFMNPEGRKLDPEAFDPLALSHAELKRKPPEALNKLRLALLTAGVDIMGSGGGVISATHGDRELEQTAAAFAEAVDRVGREEALPAL